jgi:hypothetical protein
VAGVVRGGQGVGRRIHDDGLLRLAVALHAQAFLGCDTKAALALTERLLASGGVLREGPLELRLDLAAIRAALASRMSEVVERVVPVRRGRPPSRG